MSAAPPALTRLVERVQGARSARAALEIIGGGSKRFYGEAPRGEPLSTRELSGIGSYEPQELVVTVRAGTPLAELEAALAAEGQCLPFEPPRYGAHGTVGGMVAAGLAGPARASAGSVRDHVLGVTLLDGRGELACFGGRVIKNVAGYDVSRLMAGSLGVLGLICEVSLKVMPVPPATATLCLELDEATALTRLNEWGGRPLPVSASSWCDGTLSVRLAGAHAAVAEAARALGGTALEPAVAAAFWAGLRDQADAWFGAARAAVAQGAALWRLSVPQSAAPLGLPGRQLIEWGGAQRWLYGGATVQSVRAAATAAGGHATLFLAEDRSAGVFTPLSSALAGIHRALKSAFDPDAVFNPGRLYPGL